MFLQSLTGYQALKVRYPGDVTPLATAITLPGRPLLENASEVFWVYRADELEIRVTKAASAEGTFRFLIAPVNRSPEVRPSSLAVGDTVDGEALGTIADVDEFTFQGQAGEQVVAMLQAQRPAGEGTIQLDIVDPSTGRLASVKSSGGDSTLDIQGTGVIVLPATRDYHAIVRSLRATTIADPNYEGAYRIALLGIDSTPELGPADVAIGDTVSDAVTPIGDVDIFRFAGSAGQELNVFLQALSGRPQDVLYLSVLTAAGAGLAAVQSPGDDSSLGDRPTGSFTLPETGAYNILVRGDDNGPFGDLGAYRLFVYPINHLPELEPDTLTLGDSVAETIELPGDIDEYTFTVAETTLANLVLWDDPSASGAGLDFAIEVAGFCGTYASQPPAMVQITGVAAGRGTGVFALCPGSHHVSVWGLSGFSGYRGDYRMQTYPILTHPEVVGDTLVVGDTVSGESLDVPGDFDEYVFFARKGEHVVAYFQGLATPGVGDFCLTISRSDSGGILAYVGIPRSSASLDSTRTGRLDIPADGWFRVAIQPCQVGHVPEEVGDYRFAVLKLDASPEVAARHIVIGDSIASERIDYGDDIDEFVLSGAPGTEFAVFLQGSMRLEVYDSTTQDTVRTAESAGYLQSTGRIFLPGSGTLGVRVTGVPGPYWFAVFPINRAPEVVPADVGIGDTVGGERLEPVGDIDEFFFVGSAGQNVTVYFQTPQGVTEYPGVVLEVVDTSSNAVLGSVSSINPTANLEDLSTGKITLPYSGTFLIRVQGGSDRAGATFGDYRFRITTLP